MKPKVLPMPHRNPGRRLVFVFGGGFDNPLAVLFASDQIKARIDHIVRSCIAFRDELDSAAKIKGFGACR